MSEELIKLVTVTAVEAFSGNILDGILDGIREEAKSVPADLTTAKGRTAIAANSARVSRVKVQLDKLGLGLTAEHKAKCKLVDAARKKSNDFLSDLRDEIRKPLTDWEAEQERIKQAEIQRLEDARIAEQERIAKEQRDREEALAKREEVLRLAQEKILQDKADEEARRQKEIDDQAAKEKAKIALEAQKKQAADKAKADAAAEIEAAQLRELEQKAKAERAEADRVESINLAKIAQEQAIIDQRNAVQKAKDDAKRAANEKERLRVAEEARLELLRLQEAERQKQIADTKAANMNHRKSFNNKALACFMTELGCNRETGIKIVTAIASGKIENTTINY